MVEEKKTLRKKKRVQEVTVVASAGLNVRKAADLSSGIVKVLPNGSTAMVSEVKGGWGFIGIGWILLKYTSYTALA